MAELIKNKTILAIGAHPDDIEYYAGGTLLKLSRLNKIILAIATDSDFNGSIGLRKKEQKLAATMMGMSDLRFLGFPDLEGLEKEKERLKKNLLRLILKIKPDLLFSFDPANQFHLHDDFHPAHRLLSIMVSDLILIHANLPRCINCLGLNLPPLTRKPELWLFDPYQADFIFDISDVWKQKIEFLKVFKSQNLDLKKAEKMAKGFGRKIKVSYAEGFKKVDFYSKIK